MGLFDIFKGKPQQAPQKAPQGQQSKQTITGKKILQVTQTPNFRGYKRVNLTQYFSNNDTYYNNAADMFNKYGGEYPNGATITIKHDPGKKSLAVLVDEVPIGFVYERNEQFKTFINNMVEDVVIKFEVENVIDKDKTTQRMKARMFIKIKE